MAEAAAIPGLHFVNTALSLEVFPPLFFCLEVETPSSFISLFPRLRLHESLLAVGNLNAFRPKWKISEMLDYLFLNKQVDFKTFCGNFWFFWRLPVRAMMSIHWLAGPPSLWRFAGDEEDLQLSSVELCWKCELLLLYTVIDYTGWGGCQRTWQVVLMLLVESWRVNINATEMHEFRYIFVFVWIV